MVDTTEWLKIELSWMFQALRDRIVPCTTVLPVIYGTKENMYKSMDPSELLSGRELGGSN